MEHENDPYCGQKPFNGHSQLPWRQEDGTRELGNKVVCGSGLVAICDNPHWDAAFIVHLGNTYYPTRAALQAAEGRVKELEGELKNIRSTYNYSRSSEGFGKAFTENHIDNVIALLSEDKNI